MSNKKLLLITIAALFTVNVWGQWSTPDANGKIYYNGGNVGIGITTPNALLDVSNLQTNTLSSVLARLPEGNNQGEGTYLGVKSYVTQPSVGEPCCNLKSFAIEHKFYGQTNNSINFFRGSSYTGGFITFNTSNNTEQMRINHNGNVGIGTNAPNARLDINSASNSLALKTIGNIAIHGSYLNAGNVLATIRGYHQVVDPNAYLLKVGIQGGGTGDWERFVVKGNGNVGIGTNAPNAKLDINSASNGLALKTLGNIAIYGSYLNAGNVLATIRGYHQVVDPNAYLLKVGIQGGGTGDWERFVVKGNGNVGIGTTSPNYKLAVKGTIGCGEIKVENVAIWPDFVFEPNYNLRTLKELEIYIQENKHLPEIPTTAEVKENGISVGEMNAKLLQKIEELTLYTIQQQEVIETLKQGMEAQNKRIEQLEQK